MHSLTGILEFAMYRHSWFQNNAVVEVDILAKGIPQDQVSIEFGPQSLHIVILDDYDTIYTLYDEINPSESSYKVLSTKVEIRLVKKVPDVQWPRLEQAIGEDEDATQKKSVQKNWDRIEIPADEEEDNQDDDVMGFFKKIFADADDDTRKAMMKSYQESGGTALSTNWQDVSSKNYKNNK